MAQNWGGVVKVPDKVYDGDGNVFTVTSISCNNAGDGGSYIAATELYVPDNCTSVVVSNTPNLKIIHLSKSVKSVSAINGKKIYLDSENPNFTLGNGFLYKVERDGDGNVKVNSDGHPIVRLCAWSSDYTLGADSTFNVLNGVTNIDCGLGDLPGIKHIVLPKTLQFINTDWTPPSHLEDFAVEAGNKYFYTIDGNLVRSKGNNMIWMHPANQPEEYTLPDTIEAMTCTFPYVGKVLNTNKAKSVSWCGPWFTLSTTMEKIIIGDSLQAYNNAYGTARIMPNLRTIEVSPNNKWFKTEGDSVLLSADGTIIKQFAMGGRKLCSYTIPASVKEAYLHGVNLDTLRVPSGVETLAFNYNAAVNTLLFDEPCKVSSLALGTVRKTLVLPSNITDLSAFSGTDLTVPEGSSISSLPSDMKNLKSLKIYGGNITSIAVGAFQNSTKLEEVVLPASLKNIGRNAFMDCKNLRSVTFAEGTEMETIGQGAFSGCTALEEITLPASVQTIDREAFYGCKLLSKVNLSAATTYISPEAFKRCDNLEEFTVDPENTTYSSVKGYLCSKDKSELLIFPPAKAKEDVTLLPPSITKIGEYAFYDCPNLKSIVIPKKVTKIGQRAFGLCKNLESIAFLCDSIIPSSAINQETNYMSFDDGSVEGMGNAFKNVTLSCVRADLAEQYANDPFYSKFTSGIKTTFETKREDGGVDEYFPLSNDRMMLMKTTSTLQTYVVGDEVEGEDGKVRSVNMIGDYAFEGSKAEEVVLKKNVHYLGAAAFWTNIAHTTSGAKVATGAATRATSASTEVIPPESTTIKSVYFCGDKAPSQLATVDYDMDETFNEFAPEQKIYVRKSVLKDFLSALPKYSDQIDYRITDLKITNGYATFAREFDVDLNELRSGVGNPVTGTPETVDGSYNGITAYFCGDNGVESWHADGEDHYVIHMTPIDENCNRSNYGKGYIPAGTGVLLKLETSDGGKVTPDNYYYTIGEYPDSVNVTTTSSVMRGVVDEDTVISHSTTDGTSYWVMQKGYFREVLDGQSIKIPRHKAYLELIDPAATSGSKASLSIGVDGGGTTDIVSIDANGNVESTTDGAMYNLAGQRLPENVRAHGVVIQNGKKMIMR